MDFELSETHQQLRARAKSVAEAELLPRAAEYDQLEKFPFEQTMALAREGFLAMLVPKSYGGTEAGSIAYSLAITEVARCCGSTSVTMAVTNMVGDAINAFGDEAQKQKWIPRLADGSLVAGSFCLSEAGSGSDAASLVCSAKKVGSKYILSGSKAWITSGDRSGVLLVMARTDPNARSAGISAFLVEPSMRGFSVGRHEEKMGLRASSTVTINLDEVEVPEENRLGPEGVGFKIAMRALDGGRIGVGSQALGIARAALDTAAAYVAGRAELAESQGVQWRLADAATELDAARLMVLRAAWLKEQGKPFAREASMAKVYATESANRACLAAVSVCGEDARIVERFLRDVRVTTIYEGTSEVQRIVIARAVLAEA
jgi:alkylation response protein AidB-like acyl-CoA dehydrogenase